MPINEILIDAQITNKLAKHLKAKGIDVNHVTQLPHKDRTTDQEIIQTADVQNRIVLTKDKNFINSFIIKEILNREI